jgi:hypothetical protein
VGDALADERKNLFDCQARLFKRSEEMAGE